MVLDIYVINLKFRKDRLDKIQKLYSSDLNLIIIDAIEDQEGWRGCLKSHLKCINIAKENKMKYIMVMEDDCIPMNLNSEQRLVKLKENLFDKRDDWDIFLGGSAKTWTNRMGRFNYSEDDIYKVNLSHNTHFIVYNHTSYDFFLNAEQNLPIDVIWHKKVTCIMTIPFLFRSDDGYSDIDKKYNNIKKEILNNQNKLLEYIKKNNI